MAGCRPGVSPGALVMTPRSTVAPLLPGVQRSGYGVDLPAPDRRSQQSAGLTMAMLDLLELAAGRLTATGLSADGELAVQRQGPSRSQRSPQRCSAPDSAGGWMPASVAVMKSTACSGASTDGCLGLCCPNVMVWLPEVRLLFSRCWIHSASCVGGVCWIGSRVGSRVCVSHDPHRPGWAADLSSGRVVWGWRGLELGTPVLVHGLSGLATPGGWC